jgi:ribonuclease HI
MGDDTKSYSGSEASTTNNRMELTAAIKAIESVDIKNLLLYILILLMSKKE